MRGSGSPTEKCEYGQGYYMSKPLDSESTEAVIKTHPSGNDGRRIVRLTFVASLAASNGPYN